MSLYIDIDFDDKNSQWIIKPAGEIDIYTSPKLKNDILVKIEDNPANILIDGDRLDYIDSTGLGALISIYKVVREKGFKIYIENIKPTIRKLFDITDLDQIFIIKE